MKLAYPKQRDELRMQYMLGEEFLVAPVYKAAADFPDNKMDVYLPAGEQWLDYWSKELHEGGQTIAVDVSKDNDKYLPLFVKRGAIIPMGPEIFWIDPAQHADPITLDIYPLANGQSSFTLYDDDGVSMQYQQDHYAQTEIMVNASTKNITVTVGATKGDYQGKPETHNYVLKINLLGKRSISQALLNDKKIKLLAKKPDENQANEQVAGWWIDPTSKLLYVSFNTQSSTENVIVVK
jgi:alpha-glucosidase (family GH31 glycosyl hydrolase)